jgi:hypothetical protein
MTRSVPVAVLLVVLAAGGVAHAQSSTLPSGATIVFERRKIVDPNSTSTDPFFEPQSDALRHYFNLAHCNCAQANVGKSGTPGNFEYLVQETMPSGSTIQVNIDFWVGTSCTSPVAQRDMTCMKLDKTNSVTSSLPNVDATTSHGDYVEFNLFQVVNGLTHKDEPCLQDNNVSASIFAFARALPATDTTDYDYKTSVTAGTLSTDTSAASGIDTEPPPVPLDLAARTNENEIDITWSAPASGTTDIFYYQALCTLADGRTPVFSSGTHPPQYVTSQATCQIDPVAAKLTYEIPTDIPGPLDGEIAAQPAAGDFAALDPRFICGQADTGTASSLQIKHLQNGVRYQVILVAVDNHGNFTARHFDHTITPHAVTDFWEDLHDNGNHAEGGLCLLAETYGNDSALTRVLRAFRDDTLGGSQAGRWLGRAYYATLARLGAYVHGSMALRAIAAVALAPLVAFALLWHWLGLPVVLGLLAAAWWFRRRRLAATGVLRWRRPRWLGATATAALIVLGAGPVHAGNGGYRPYWESTDPTQSEQERVPPGDPSLVSWHAGVRVGPYTPDIGNPQHVEDSRYVAHFDTDQHLLTMLDVDYILWTGFGQVGVGGSIGYWQKTARAFATDINGMTTTVRSNAPEAFRLVPSALTATYRFTMLDDNYGIPLVPYARGGLSYYVWWVAVNGHYARICDPAGQNCGEKALGASLGLQGAIGVALRAERIDASTAMSMQQSGIQHAGIYAELSLAKVNGFGSSTKLSVGDKGWFAGVDFEF